MRNAVQLITYVDRLSGGGFSDLSALLRTELAQLFGGVHVLPFFHPIDGADAGFDPIDHARVDPRLGSWDDVRALSTETAIVVDLIVNHISSASPEFLDFSTWGRASAYSGMFLTLDRVFPDGVREEDLRRIYRPRPSLPLTLRTLHNGDRRVFWTTFTADQIDIDVRSTEGDAYLQRILETFAAAGVSMVRLDAAGYAIKAPGTSCFLIPETLEFVSSLTARAHALGIQVLAEIHANYEQQIEIARRVDRVYDFALPPLVLHALYRADGAPLKAWLAISPRNAVTVLDTHDGIGVRDVGADPLAPAHSTGLLPPPAIDALVEEIHRRSGGESRLATGTAASNLDLYQVNCTYYDALGGHDTDYLIARAIQFFAPGIPQVYYVGLLAGRNDLTLLRRSGIGRDINRHYYTRDEVSAALKTPVVRQLCELIRLRNDHPAFSGEFTMGDTPSHELHLEWRHGAHRAALVVDLAARSAVIRCTGDGVGADSTWHAPQASTVAGLLP
jgi:sucrose phosphorylase